MTKKKAISILRKWRNIGTKDMTSERLGYIEGWFGKDDSEAFAMAIKALQEKKVGHWHIHENKLLGKCGRVSYECSECGVWVGCENFVRNSYCPNCGAEMKDGDTAETHQN